MGGIALGIGISPYLFIQSTCPKEERSEAVPALDRTCWNGNATRPVYVPDRIG